MRWAWLLLAGATMPALAQSDLPPAELAARALDAQPTVEAAVARVTAARAEGDAMRIGPHEITAQGTVSRRSIEQGDRFAEYDATISRPFRLPGKAALDRRAGALGVEIAQDRMEDVRHHAALTLGSLWYDWLLAAELHRNAGALVQTQQALVDGTRRRVRARDAAELDLQQAEAALALAQAQRGDAAAMRDRARALLGSRFPDLPLPIDPPGILAPVASAEELSELQTLIVERSHEIAAASGEAARESVLAQRARADRIADPSLGVRLFSERGGEERGAGLFVSLPLGGGHRRAVARRAEAQASAAQSELTAVEREIIGDAAADVAEYRARHAAWEASRDAVSRAEQSAALAARGQQLGAIDLADRLYADRQANEARAQELTARAAAARLILKLRIDSHMLWMD
ncbi:heavy metal efflux system protein [Sphingobium sp. SYK-6]|uniref:TolC family protein n=1 Tax=Sphingobium sp. (strain NBRC 103272 / SYK-6) TaxID=627192 RepID=UPI0002276B55|nr:TolC family protein [Sphingobium sp. SYK-6]BAK65472.1 heavy metal efflux system protein [Sphingobium sp. SYK-6]